MLKKRKIKVGDKIKFKSERQRYTVRACDERFVIATKPFNLQKTYIYTIVDLLENKRSSDNYYCRFDYEDEQEAQKALKLLNRTVKSRESDGIDFNCNFWLSSRRIKDLDIERIDGLNKN